MKRNLLMSALAALAALAACAVAASSAAASTHVFTSPLEKTVLTGEQVGTETDNYFEFKGTSLKTVCKKVFLSGTVIGKEAQEVIRGSTTMKECTAFGASVVVETAGCELSVTGETVKSESGSHAPIHLTCSAGQAVKVTAPGCTISFGSQTPALGARVTTEESGGIKDLKADVTLEKLKYTSKGVLCAVTGLPSEGENGFLASTITGRGYEDLCKVGECPINGDEFKEGAQVSITDHEIES